MLSFHFLYLPSISFMLPELGRNEPRLHSSGQLQHRQEEVSLREALHLLRAGGRRTWDPALGHALGTMADTLCPMCEHMLLCTSQTTLVRGHVCTAALAAASAPPKQTPLFLRSWQSSFVGGEAVNTEPCPSCSAAGCESRLQQEAAGGGGGAKPGEPGAGQTCCSKLRAGEHTQACPVPSQPRTCPQTRIKQK